MITCFGPVEITTQSTSALKNLTTRMSLLKISTMWLTTRTDLHFSTSIIHNGKYNLLSASYVYYISLNIASTAKLSKKYFWKWPEKLRPWSKITIKEPIGKSNSILPTLT